MSVHRSPTGSGLRSPYADISNKTITSYSIDKSHTMFHNKRELEENEKIKSDIAQNKNKFIEMEKKMLSMQKQMSELIAYLVSNANRQF